MRQKLRAIVYIKRRRALPANSVLILITLREMHYTYILKSVPHPSQSYVGFTTNLKQRLEDHNSGKSPHTNKFKPWNLDFYCAFQNEEKAVNFEKYLKSGSGRSFAKKHFETVANPTQNLT